MKNLIFTSVVLVIAFSFILNAQVPKKISYQGLITTSDAIPVQDGYYDLRLDIYNAPIGGTILWSEPHNSVLVEKGTFSIILGTHHNLDLPFDRSYYVEVTVVRGPGILRPIIFTPRSELTTSPYSFRADTAAYAYSAGSIGGTAGGDLTGNYPNPLIAANAVTSTKILDGTIQRIDVNGSFKSPYSDTADYAKSAPPVGNAGGSLTGTYPNPLIANNTITSEKIVDGSVSGIDIAKPCTLSASLSIPTLRVENTGTGDAGYFVGNVTATGRLKGGNAKAEVSSSISTSTSSTTWADLANMTLNVTTGASQLLIIFTATGVTLNQGSTTNMIYFQLLLDNNPIAYATQDVDEDFDPECVSIIRMPTVSAGSHTIKVQWKVSADIAYCPYTTNEGTRTLIAIEIP